MLSKLTHVFHNRSELTKPAAAAESRASADTKRGSLSTGNRRCATRTQRQHSDSTWTPVSAVTPLSLAVTATVRELQLQTQTLRRQFYLKYIYIYIYYFCSCEKGGSFTETRSTLRQQNCLFFVFCFFGCCQTCSRSEGAKAACGLRVGLMSAVLLLQIFIAAKARRSFVAARLILLLRKYFPFIQSRKWSCRCKVQICVCRRLQIWTFQCDKTLQLQLWNCR